MTTNKIQAWLICIQVCAHCHWPFHLSLRVPSYHTIIAFSWVSIGHWLCSLLYLLQVLSNLANDYGDSEKGTDNADRIGPKRAVQSGISVFQ